MSKFLLICIESPLKKSDHMYIETFLKKIYNINSDIKLKFLSLNGIDNYNKDNTLKRINSEINASMHSEKHIIYCLDTDNYNSPEYEKRNKSIQEFCNVHNYELVWFCKNIEEVFLGKSISKSEKLQEARKFVIGIKNYTIDEQKLLQDKIKNKMSNFLLIFDKYLSRKNFL